MDSIKFENKLGTTTARLKHHGPHKLMSVSALVKMRNLQCDQMLEQQ